MSCYLDSGGDGQRGHGTRMDLEHMPDRQARARVTRGGGSVTTRLSMSMRGGRSDLGENTFLNSAEFEKTNLGALDSPGCHNHSLQSYHFCSTFVPFTWYATPPPQHIHLKPLTHAMGYTKKKKRK